MRIAELAVAEIAGTPAQPVGSPAHRQRARSGLLLRLTDTDGADGLGEASPLPGYSSDCLADCRAALLSLDVATLNARLKNGPGGVRERLARSADLVPVSAPAARFALETALLDLECRRRHTSPFELLQREPLEGLAANALVDAGQSDLVQAAQSYLARGFGTIKVKLGEEPERTVAALEVVSRKTSLALRVDANRGLDPGRSNQLLPRLAQLDLEFLEEPCAPESWSKLPARRPPLALDESLLGATSAGLSAMVSTLAPRAIVLKPMAIGGITRSIELADCARHLGLEVVITHLFDGPLAHRAASALALMLQSGKLAAGLAQHPGLEAWPSATLALTREVHLDPSLLLCGLSPPEYGRAFVHASFRRL